jgi:hypothetical protein
MKCIPKAGGRAGGAAAAAFVCAVLLFVLSDIILAVYSLKCAEY